MRLIALAVAVVAALCASTAATAIPNPGVVKIHRKNVKMTVQEHMDHQQKRLQFMTSKEKGEASVLLHTAHFLYFIEIFIGTPPQKVLLDIDTGSSDLWFTTKTRHLSCAHCTGPKAFDSTKSSSFVPWTNAFKIAFADTTTATGFIAVETVSWGGIEIRDQTFGAILKTNATGPEYNGLIGLGFIALSSGTTPAFYNLWNQKLIMNPYFGMYLPRFDIHHDNGGELTLGGINKQLIQGDVKWYPSLTQDFYKIGLSAVKVDHKSVAIKSIAIIDSGTSLAYVPTKIFHEMFNGRSDLTLCKSSNPKCAGAFTFKCKNPPKFEVSFFFGKDKYSINPIDLNAGPIDDKGEICLFAILNGGPINVFLLGDTFMRNYYTVFSPINNKIGLAKLRKGGAYF